jgi:hypothetical protein
MTTSSRYARIGPVAWLILQGVATVASILLAFGIDAWWDKHNVLNRHTSLLQLNNESFRFGRPGTGSGADPTQVVPVAELTDHTSLLGNREFQGVLVQKMWIDLDVESTLCTDVAREIDKAVRLIDRETANSS